MSTHESKFGISILAVVLLFVTGAAAAFGALAGALCIVAAVVAQAQGTEPNLAGKTATIYIGYGPGGGYDLYGRVLARHLGKHLPGRPVVVVANMPGAASIRAANYLYNVAPKDGTALGIVAQSIAEEQLLGTAGVSYDVAKFNWIGRFSGNVEVSYVWHTSPVKTLDDLTQTEARFAGTGPSSSIYPKLLNSIAGMKWKVIQGYNTTVEAHLAMQRGEVDGATSSLTTLKTREAEWLSKRMINVLIQYAANRSAELAAVPAVVELGKTQEDKDVLAFYANSAAVGRSIIAPPAMAADRVTMLRMAFDATLKDPEFLSEIAATKLDFDPTSGTDLQNLVESATKVSKAVLDRARAARAE